MTRPQPRLPSPYRPDARPHLARTWVLLALIGAALLVTVWVAGELVRPQYTLPVDVTTEPYGGYDPGLYTPFTHPPAAPR